MPADTPILSLAAQADSALRAAFEAALGPQAAGADPIIRPSEHADYQANGLLALAKKLKGNPRELAGKVVAQLDGSPLFAHVEASGPGFVNLTFADTALAGQLAARGSDPKLGLGKAASRPVTVVDYSAPNIAKEMHVGHLRSTIIGDALVRLLTFSGSEVIRQNHVGDWGTQFGMLIEHLLENPDVAGGEEDGDTPTISRLAALYKAARARFNADEEFQTRSRQRVVALQSGDPETLAGWQEIVAESKTYFGEIYSKLGVLLTDEDIAGESSYNDELQGIADDLERRGVAVRSEGALCVFFDDVVDKDGKPVPFIIQKSDGGFGYPATDLATLRHRVRDLKAARLLYVVGSPQALHFKMVFETARRAGYLPEGVEAEHVQFGSVLGADGKPFKSREGETIRLISLLDEAVARARATIAERSPGLSAQAQEQRAQEVGIGAVKYADLSTSRTRDYVFDLDRMLSLQGNTGVYLQYAHARIRSMLARLAEAEAAPDGSEAPPLEPAERALVRTLDEFGATLDAVAESLEPHRLCAYLYALAQAFSDFYEACPVLKAPTAQIRARRVAICELTGDTLALGLSLLGIAAPERL
ncbi:arginine--tRNA ligase [Segniliparus rugosus]|uniref:Arginine--tRNA ligase n=1 Tax=Segniliparus rugosus (strain ATCC BAA-974 / DSM 45345 / CCUG 50838 / CIP 108380 / JCM 13579 / CDC 945) TaxID=679197 RepID=E5XLV0_SEGRC|nr:arginine--tRNA ligase [Segniliparus rugosus]EFV14677.1 arginine-tRNA ligase [Segniliparus rugosus ATCC BAA-974]